MPSTRYGEIAPRVREICRRYELPYNTGPLFKQLGMVHRTIIRLAFPGGKLRPKPGPVPRREGASARASCARHARRPSAAWRTLATGAEVCSECARTAPKPFCARGTRNNPSARPTQRGVRRHRVARAQRLHGRPPRDARADHAAGQPSSTTRRPPRPQPGHPALARDRPRARHRRGQPGPPAPVLPRGDRRAQGPHRRERVRPAAVRLRAARQRLRPALLPQALPAPQRRRRGADGDSTPRTPRYSASSAPSCRPRASTPSSRARTRPS